MENFGVRTLALAILVITGTLMIGNYRVTTTTCHRHHIHGLKTKCAKFVTKEGPKILPSEEQGDQTHTCSHCACKHVTKKVEKSISMEKAVYVAKSCGKHVPKGMKCGSKNFRLMNCKIVLYYSGFFFFFFFFLSVVLFTNHGHWQIISFVTTGYKVPYELKEIIA